MRRVALVLGAMALGLLLASGVAWAVNKVGTNGPDTLRGTNSADNFLGRGGNDILLGRGGTDNLLGATGKDIVLGGNAPGGNKNLVGGLGNDAVFGGIGSDNILGEAGNDFLVDSGPVREFATDELSAGDGNDVIAVVNSPAFEDIVSCGGNLDWVLADRKDVLAPDCEKVFFGLDADKKLDAASSSHGFWEGLHPQFSCFVLGTPAPPCPDQRARAVRTV
jgi:RTX calcium-binding nonapeptide repeat (4 copies)